MFEKGKNHTNTCFLSPPQPPFLIVDHFFRASSFRSSCVQIVSFMNKTEANEPNYKHGTFVEQLRSWTCAHTTSRQWSVGASDADPVAPKWCVAEEQRISVWRDASDVVPAPRRRSAASAS